MNKLLLAALLVLAFGFQTKESPTVRESFYTIPLQFLPALKTQMSEDSRYNRDRMIMRNEEDRGFMVLEKKGDPTDTRLQQYFTSADNEIVCIETTGCEDNDCTNSFIVIAKQGENWIDVTSEMAPEIDYNDSKVRGMVKKFYKDIYGNLEEFEESEYDTDEGLRKGVIWTINDQENEILLKETRLPQILFKLVWNKKKNTFDTEKVK